MPSIRIGAVQYKMKPISSFEQFAEQAESHVQIGADFGAKFLLFPELFTTQLLSIAPDRDPLRAIRSLDAYTEAYIVLFTRLAKEHNLYIIAGTHVGSLETKPGLYNAAYLFAPDGSRQVQEKVHLTPTEKNDWKLDAGDAFRVFETEYGKIAIVICYDIEFPEAVSTVVQKGAELLFCPSCTDDEQGFYRVRFTSHARTIEHQVSVAVTGTVGYLPNVRYMESNVGQAAILVPCDVPFPPQGIVNQGIKNEEMVIFGDVDLSMLREIRENGSVRPWHDRRPDVYGK
ncbi:carbon-nitrogen hydrolase family protein [Brevibacillus massiliensis]|uniref:carbon-nitrogen hydrolase family protein n=1 Tax=Brevibacillus massiliensis TaxID=1118054 RepID=UPI0003008905|nr:carbon-nitrogen hydrolase family protein [Brevibacillus massiliensis]